MHRLLHTVPLALVLGVGTAQSQTEPVTTTQGMASAQSGQKAQLRGRIMGRQGPNQYFLSDRSGKVLVEIDSKLLKGRKLPAGTDVEIRGEVDKRNKESPRIEARAVTVLASATRWE